MSSPPEDDETKTCEPNGGIKRAEMRRPGQDGCRRRSRRGRAGCRRLRPDTAEAPPTGDVDDVESPPSPSTGVSASRPAGRLSLRESRIRCTQKGSSGYESVRAGRQVPQESGHSDGRLDGFLLMSLEENIPSACEVFTQRLATLPVLRDSVCRARDGGERRGPPVRPRRGRAPRAGG